MALIGGAESMIWPCLALGMIGNTATTASFWPESVVEIYDAAVRGDAHEAQALYLRLAEYRMLCKAAGHAAVVKAGMDMVGLAGGPVRPPLPVMTDAHREHLARILREFEVLPSGVKAAKPHHSHPPCSAVDPTIHGSTLTFEGTRRIDGALRLRYATLRANGLIAGSPPFAR